MGLGYQLSLDTRNQVNWPTRGYYLLWKQMHYNETLGDYDYLLQTLDGRVYAPLFWGISIACGGIWDMRRGMFLLMLWLRWTG